MAMRAFVLAAVLTAANTLGGAIIYAAKAATTEEIEASGVSQGADKVEVVVVTAQKRSEDINDVGMAISALGAQQLENQRIISLSDVAAAVPSLTYATSTNNTPILTLRGIGFNDKSLASYPAVSVYLDEAPLTFPVLSALAVFDLERVEVLKGPQGTLFGQNSTGGAINFIARKPTDFFEAGGTLSYGRFNEVDVTGYISGPLSQTVRARVAINVNNADPWQKSYTTDGEIGKTKKIAGRIITDWTPSDKLRVEFDLNAWTNRSDPQVPQILFQVPQQPCCILPEVANYPLPPSGDARAADWSDGPNRPSQKATLYQGILRVDWDVTDWVTLTSLTSYTDYSQNVNLELDGMTYRVLQTTSDGWIKDFNQEIRLANVSGGDVRWVVGGNFNRSNTSETNNITWPDSSTAHALPFAGANDYGKQSMMHYAFFGNADYNITEKVTIKAGARWTSSHQRADSCFYDNGDGSVIGFMTYLSRLLTGDPSVPPVLGSQCATLLANFLPSRDPVRGNLNQNSVSWRVGVDTKPTDNLLLYANVAQGYKAGSFPVDPKSTYLALAPVVKEGVLSYEAGAKATLADGLLTLDSAVYYYDYKDKQVYGAILDPVFGVVTKLVNVPKSRVYGAEITLTARPASGWNAQLSGSYNNAQIEQYLGYNSAGTFQDFAGTPMSYTPKFQLSADTEYNWVVGDAAAAFIGGTIRYQSSSYAVLGGEQIVIGSEHPYFLDRHFTLDLRAGLTWPDSGWGVTVWAKNVTNEYYRQNVVTYGDAIVGYTGRPATFGVSVSAKFNGR